MDGKLLFQLFDERERAYTEATSKIAKELDFVLEAINEVLEIKDEDVTWQSFDLQDTMFVFIGKLGLETSNAKLITAAIPVHLVEKGKEAIIEFLSKENEKNQTVDEYERQSLNKIRQTIAQEQEDEEFIDEEPLPEIVDPTSMLGESLLDYIKRNNRPNRTLH